MIKKHAEVGVLLTAVDGVLYTVMQLNDGRRMTKAVYTVRNNRKQFLRITMPVGAEIWSASVSGNAATPAKDEKGEHTPAASGSLKVQLPTMDALAMHVMVNYCLPAEGDYTLPEGLFGRKSGFSGTLRVVESFTTLSKADAVMSTVKNMSNKVAVEDMQKQFDTQAAQQARAAGAEPVRVALPVNGTLFRLEKILALPGDNLYFQVEYSGWKVGQ